MSTERFIQEEELSYFSTLSLKKRLKWIREQLNDIYNGEYTVKQVAKNSGSISHQGLYNLEKEMNESVRPSTIKSLARYYQVPLEALEDAAPTSFFLGKQTKKISPNELRGAFYQADIKMNLTYPDGSIEEKTIIKDLDLRHYDAEKLVGRIQEECNWIEKDLRHQQKVSEAIQNLTSSREENPDS